MDIAIGQSVIRDTDVAGFLHDRELEGVWSAHGMRMHRFQRIRI
jgi:hypothetical protein